MELVLTKNISPNREPLDRKAYEQAGGYQALRKALSQMTPQQVRDEVLASGLRGRGGAGFPTGKKWQFAIASETPRRPRYFCINADEMEPGTFKDRVLMEGDPHQLIESAVCSCYALDVDICYIFLRREYVLSARRLAQAIAEAYEAGYLGKNILGSKFSLELRLHTSAGRYMCGEENGLINALEGRRATPRAKPPYPASVGLFGKPTIVNNVETVANILHIVNRGGAWFQKLTAGVDGGTKLYGVSGRVKQPGCWELPMGTPLREILDLAGGMKDGLTLRGLLPGGASTPFMTTDHMDVKMDFTSVEQAGARLGTGTMIILDDKTCPVGLMRNLMKFYSQESCGWCTPCREGLPWLEKILSAMEAGEGTDGDLEMLGMHCRLIQMGHTFCALAPGAIDPLVTAMKYFRDDFERHVKERHCPYRKT